MSKIDELLDVLEMSSTEFADYCKIPRSTVSHLRSGRMKNLPDTTMRKLIVEKNMNANWWFTGTGSVLKPFEQQSTDALKSLAMIGRINRRPKLKKIVDLILEIQEDHYDQVETILKTFRK
ncbi:XRE family transcriptional regulator [Leptospira interrogans]|uniref:DNA-binding protein n=2 Tax=Leptospira TaxID=171 RepID=UPI0009E65B81|nr:DNA-binding protein [Leptospira interrogans]UMQ54058.1 XRE family transcriptional regulator [Leptospira interrogans]